MARRRKKSGGRKSKGLGSLGKLVIFGGIGAVGLLVLLSGKSNAVTTLPRQMVPQAPPPPRAQLGPQVPAGFFPQAPPGGIPAAPPPPADFTITSKALSPGDLTLSWIS